MIHTISSKDGIIRVKTSGEMEVQGFISYLRDVMAHEHWNPGGRILSDHTELKGFTADIPNIFDKVSNVAVFFKENQEKFGRAVLASVLPDTDAAVATSLWNTLREHIGVDIVYKNFYDLKSAEQWVKSV